MSVSLKQPMRDAEIDLVELANANETAIKTVEGYFPIATTNIADGAVTNAKLATSAVNVDNITDGAITTIKLNEGIQSQLSFLASVPALEFGTSNSVTIGANSHTVVDITFGSTKTEEPVVFPAIQSATAGVNLIATVQSVTNAQCSICITNLGTTDVSDVTVDYLAISGR